MSAVGGRSGEPIGEQTRTFRRVDRPWDRPRGVSEVLARWESDGTWRNVTWSHGVEAQEPSIAAMPSSLSPLVARALSLRGIDQLYSHQAEAFELAPAGKHVVVATPTASGKSLCYNLPILQALASDPSARALYLFPTKALSRDQEESLRQLMRDADLPIGTITYDGDTPDDARRAARQRAGVLLTNPDMLHAGIMPHHTAWARLFSNLRYVVIDELHTYRGVFGSHLANVVRRLLRIARFHGSSPTFLFASATIGNPKEHAQRICGEPVELIEQSGAPTGPRRVILYNPPVVNAELGIRQSYLKTAVRLTQDLVRAGVPTLVFGNSRNGVEVMLKYLRDRLARDQIDASTIHAYRGGYLPDTRRRIEAALRAGDIRCVVATNALELGIDIGALDAVVCAGYPGTMAGLWQRFGRAGRRRDLSLSVLVSSSNPVDQYVARHPRQLVSAPIEHARIDPDNIEILIQHLKCAAFELPFEPNDLYGDVPDDALAEALDYLADNGVIHPTPSSAGSIYHWASDSYPANNVSLRSASWDNFVIIDLDGNRTIAEMDWRSTHTMLHEQAIYQHEGGQYQVERLDFDNHKAFVRRVKPDYYTTAMTHSKVTVLEHDQGAMIDLDEVPLEAALGDVSVIEKVVGYKKIKFHTHENVGYGEVHLPEMQKHTTAFWLTFPEDFVQSQPEPRAVVVDALRGLSKAMHVVGAVGLMIDPRDLGRTLGSRTEDDALPGNGQGPGYDPTIFLYDTVAGGVGLAPRLFEERVELLRRARRLIESCDCDEGCPGCIGPDASGDDEPEAARKQLVLGLLDAVGICATH
ncbi:MAG: DEAD/DEAH box helicase [Myxococcales bacterium]|nr:DEAD/DEAH box helicase [Myxococcales bacterium]MDH3843933.1 DEAD/DEAH box helicase [Myxococcales bacterium]